MQLRKIIWGMLLIALAGCETTGGGGGNVKPDAPSTNQAASPEKKAEEKGGMDILGMTGKAFTNVTNRILGKGTFKETGLFELFKDKQDPKSGWPRVAITIHKFMDDAWRNAEQDAIVGYNRELSEICMTYSAVIWYSEKEKKEVPQQEYCASELIGKRFTYQGMYLPMDLWGNSRLPGKGSGTERTNGPLWPAYALPQGSDYLKFTYMWAAIPLYSILRLMDFDPQVANSNFGEKRVWVVSMPSKSQDRKSPIKRKQNYKLPG